MKRRIITTADGSKSIHIEDWDEQYHSKHGAIQEALHVFIAHGYQFYKEKSTNQPIHILEIGFGTGLNALLTAVKAQADKTLVRYTGVEAYPVDKEEIAVLNYPDLIDAEQASSTFQALHTSAWEQETRINDYFSLTKRKQRFEAITDQAQYDLIYFDAFGARVQPDLWEKPIFQQMWNALANQGVLVTYSAKGSVRRAMQSVGFQVSKLPGPPGKREMLRAVKQNQI